MKKVFYLAITLFSWCLALQAQWSVLNTDEIPKQTAFKYQPFTKEEWNSSNFAGPKKMEWFSNARYGMFIHFGLSAYVKKDISWSICETRKAPDQGHGSYPDSVWRKWPSKFKLENFDANEWVQIAKNAGMKYIVVIAKHHDGFHMWDTQFSDFKITNTPFGRDYLKEIADACHKINMPFGIYYSQRDWYHPDYAPVDTSETVNTHKGNIYKSLNGGNPIPGPTHQKYLNYQQNAIKELLTKYGKVDIFWFDAAWWGGMFTADMWDAENLTRMMRKLQPNIIINNRASLPGDFDTPEQQVGRYQTRPWESALTVNDSWAYSPAPNRSKKELLRDLLSCAQGNGNVLLSWGAHWDGKFDPVQKDLLMDVGKWLKKYGYAFYNTKGGPWMPGKWGGATYKDNKIYLYVYNWNNDQIKLPALNDNSIVSSRYLNVQGEKVNFKTGDEGWQFSRPVHADSIATIIELVMSKPVKEALYKKNSSAFEGMEYGVVIENRQISGAAWKKNQYVLDLKKSYKVTGIGIYEGVGNIVISVSPDGKTWTEVGKTNTSDSEISLTTNTAGAEVLGNIIRYVKLNTVIKPSKTKIMVYSK